MATLKLTTLECLRQQDVIGKDEPRLVVNGTVAWSGVLDKGESTNLAPAAVPFDQVAEVRLQEMNGGRAKQIGDVVTLRAGQDGTGSAVFKTSGTHYKLWYKIS